MRSLLRAVWLFIPPSLLVAGWSWIDQATSYFERLTGRGFYGLAGYHYSAPEWGFKYLEGGEHIERWALTIPTNTTLLLFFMAALAMTILERKRGLGVILVGWVYHVIWTLVFLVITVWYAVNITGVFI